MDYTATIEQMKSEGSPIPLPRPVVKIQNSEIELKAALSAIGNRMGENFEWLPEYDQVADWLSDNKGKGLFLLGAPGRGKSIMIRYAIPMIFRARLPRVFTVVDMANPTIKIDDLLTKKYIALDDIGAEVTRKVFGTERNIATEIISMASDVPDVLLIASSNLSMDAIESTYGARIADRIKYLCRRIPFNGKSMRK